MEVSAVFAAGRCGQTAIPGLLLSQGKAIMQVVAVMSLSAM
jgi:hypothetical protein